jgi:hypothetical protein
VRQFYAGQTFAHPEVEMVEGTGAHANKHLVLAQVRVRNVFVAKNLGPAELVNASGFHTNPAETKLTQERSFPFWEEND